MRRLLSYLSICAVIATILTGCSSAQAAASSLPIESSSATVQSESSTAVSSLTQSSSEPPHRFEIYGGYVGNTDDATLIAELPPQILIDEPICYRLSQAIMNLSYFGGTDWRVEFDSIDKASYADLMLGALYHTPSIIIPLESSGDTWYSKDYPNHPLVALLNHEMAEGRWLEELYYQEDVEKTFRYLYGSRTASPRVEFFHSDLMPYYYYKVEGVYGICGAFGGPMRPYPQVTGYKKTTDGYTVDVISPWALDKDTPLEENGVPLTKENFMELTKKRDWIRYTFVTAEDGRFLLNGVKYLRRVPRSYEWLPKPAQLR